MGIKWEPLHKWGGLIKNNCCTMYTHMYIQDILLCIWTKQQDCRAHLDLLPEQLLSVVEPPEVLVLSE